jgi:dienelactone hydrolase
MRGTIIYGTDDDSIPQSGIQVLASHLNRAGITCDLEAIPGGPHNFQPDYAESLLRGLDDFEYFWGSD